MDVRERDRGRETERKTETVNHFDEDTLERLFKGQSLLGMSWMILPAKHGFTVQPCVLTALRKRIQGHS